MSYERTLAFYLRLRGLSEPEIAEVIHDVRAHEASTETPPATEFGTAAEYAKQFPKKKRRTRGHTITAVGTALAVAYVLLTVLLMFVGIDVREYVGPITLLPAFVLIIAGVLTGFLTDYFLPAQRFRAVR